MLLFNMYESNFFFLKIRINRWEYFKKNIHQISFRTNRNSLLYTSNINKKNNQNSKNI